MQALVRGLGTTLADAPLVNDIERLFTKAKVVEMGISSRFIFHALATKEMQHGTSKHGTFEWLSHYHYYCSSITTPRTHSLRIA